MKKAFQIFDKIIEWIEILVSVSTLCAITVLIFLQVVLRYVFKSSLVWTEEVVITMVVFMALFGAARGVRKNEHTEVAGVANALPRPAGIALRVVTNVITIVSICLIIYGSFFLAGRTRTVSAILRYNMSINYYAIAFGAVLMLYEYLKKFRGRILGTEKQEV